MADVEVSYKGSTIGSLSASGTLTLETEGKYCEDDIGIAYTSPGGGGGGVTVETVDVTVDNQKKTSLEIPVTSTNYDNIVVAVAMTEAWHYDSGTPVQDNPIALPALSDGFDIFEVYSKLKSSPRFSGTINSGGTTLSNVYDYVASGTAARNSNAPAGLAKIGTGLTIASNKITISSLRAFCQAGYKQKFTAKIYFWDD